VSQFDPKVLNQLAETMRQSGVIDAARANLAGIIDCLARPDWAEVLRGPSQYVQGVAAAIADFGMPVGQEDLDTTHSSLGEVEWDEATRTEVAVIVWLLAALGVAVAVEEWFDHEKAASFVSYLVAAISMAIAIAAKVRNRLDE
jgi:hypothetical protein